VVNGFQFAGNIRRKGIPCGTSGNLKQEKQKNHTSHKFTLLSVHEHLEEIKAKMKKKNPTNKKQKAKIHTLSPFPRKP